ncbi:MAG TPA: hypothetical protein VK773_13145 [Acidimicrobiales bacterium]|nr:hypothetical protein [Acidimicrobiales bacterium]
MARKWLGLVIGLAALTVSCLLPGSLLTSAPPAGRVAAIELAVPAVGSVNCAAVICNRGTPSAPGLVPAVSVAVALLSGLFLVLVATAVRRRRRPCAALPTGNPLRLLRPPQLGLFA